MTDWKGGKMVFEVDGSTKMTENLKKAYCPHFREVMDLNDCFFCYFKKVKKR